MISIKKNQEKNLVFTLQENSKLSPSYYIFRFYDLNNDIVFNAVDSSLNPDGYNEFNMTEGTTFTLPEGQYNYQVYETSTQGSTTIDDTTNLLEVGLLRVDPETVTKNIFNGETTFKAFNG